MIALVHQCYLRILFGVRLFEESLIVVRAGGLHTILHAGDLHVPGPGKGGRCVSHT